MRISIDATGLSVQKTGTVTYLVEILSKWNADPHVTHEFFIFCAPSVRQHFDALGLDQRFRLIHTPSRKPWQMLWQQTVLPYRLWRDKIDVHWGPGFVLPLVSACPMVVTVHDMTFDLFPEVHEPLKRIYFPWMIRAAVARAMQVLVISQSTGSDLGRLIPSSQSKTVVTLLAPRPWIKAPVIKPPASSPYVLFVGTLEPRKNLKRLLNAWRCLNPTERGDCRLTVVGAAGWMIADLTASVSAQDNVDFVGHVSDTALLQYLNGALFFAYPSIYEGFGLPVIEAMALGIPVLTSDVGATQEIAKGAAWLVNPASETSIAEGLKALLNDATLRQTLARAGLKRSAHFTWQRTSNETLETLLGAADDR
jgi:glycosyltransferase involved in cell wall biosynthesis